MRYIEKNHVIHTFSPEHPPVSRARSGETVTFETYDCYKGQLLPGDTTFADLDRGLENPATGPLFVEEAAPGMCCGWISWTFPWTRWGFWTWGPPAAR